MKKEQPSIQNNHFSQEVYANMDGVFGMLPFYVLLLDHKHHILYANAAVQTSLGLDTHGIIGGYCPKIIHGQDCPIPECPLEESVASNCAVEREIYDAKLQMWFSSAIYPTNYVIDDGSKVYLHMVHDITKRKEAEIDLANSLQRLEDLTEAGVKAITLIVETRDPYTAGHQSRVSKLACRIALKMGYDKKCLKGIEFAALLHDVGKIAVPIEILTKPGHISKDEFRIIQTHSNVAYNILKDIEFERPIATTVLQHHEKLDGSGYPNGLKGGEIIMDARILCVADVVEAITSHRPYRPALSIEVALDEIIKNRGILYDADVVDVCVKLIKEEQFIL